MTQKLCNVNNPFIIFKKAISAKFNFSLLVIFHTIVYAIILFYTAFSLTVAFSAVWTVEYLFGIRRFLTNPIDDFAAKKISYAQPNMFWVNFAKKITKPHIFIFTICIHVFMALLPTFVYRNFLYSPIIIATIFFSNMILPTTYLFILRKIFLLWKEKSTF